MTRRTAVTLALIAVAALLAWFLVVRAGREPRASAFEPRKIENVGSEAAAAGPHGSAVPGDQAAPDERRDATRTAFAQRTRLYARASEVDAAGLDALIEQARATPDAVERIATLEILLLKLAERDPAAAVRIALEGERPDALRLVSALAGAAPEAVWNELAYVGDPLARRAVLSSPAN